MDIKRVFILIFSALAASILFVTCLHFMVEPEEDKSVFSMVGDSVVAGDFGEVDAESRQMLNDIQNTQAPEVRYNESTYATGNKVQIKSLLRVKPAGAGEFVSGETESGFSIVILDVMDEEGNTINPVSEEVGEESDVIMSKAYYNQQEETILFNEKGVYRIQIRVYGENGRYITKEIKVPVED